MQLSVDLTNQIAEAQREFTIMEEGINSLTDYTNELQALLHLFNSN